MTVIENYPYGKITRALKKAVKWLNNNGLPKNFEEFREKAQFTCISHAAYNEGMPHGQGRL